MAHHLREVVLVDAHHAGQHALDVARQVAEPDALDVEHAKGLVDVAPGREGAGREDVVGAALVLLDVELEHSCFFFFFWLGGGGGGGGGGSKKRKRERMKKVRFFSSLFSRSKNLERMKKQKHKKNSNSNYSLSSVVTSSSLRMSIDPRCWMYTGLPSRSTRW